MFEKVVAAPADPILGLTEEFKKILALKNQPRRWYLQERTR